MSKTVSYEFDLTNPPPLTTEQHAELKEMAATPEESINYDDIPPLDDAFWKNAKQNPFYQPTKISTRLRVDSDVLASLKSQGKGYQTKINSILREAMIRALQHKP